VPRTRRHPPSLADTNGRVAYRVGLKDLPLAVRPRERLQHGGAGSLSDAELLAIILRTGTPTCNVLELSARLLARRGGLAGVDQASLAELCQESGLGPAKAIEIKAALELGRRLVSLNPGQRAQVQAPEDIWNLVRADMSTFDQERLRVLLLSTKNQVLGASDVYQGTLNSTTVRVGELFKEAIRQNAAAIALVHNHPSGDPTPSAEDIRLTGEVVEAGRLLDIEVLDHIVVGRGDGRFVSLKREGLGFSAARR
jgi:DNA repair protein RadC